MPPLFRLVVEAETVTDTVLDASANNYFYIFSSADVVEGTLHAPADKFVDDQDNPVTELELADPDNGYYLLVINGMMQQASVFTVSLSELTVDDADDILEGSPIVLTVTNFVPQSTSTTTVAT